MALPASAAAPNPLVAVLGSLGACMFRQACWMACFAWLESRWGFTLGRRDTHPKDG